MLSSSVQTLFREALTEAHRRRNDLLTLEHLLYAMMRNTKGRVILEGSGVSIAILREQLEMFFKTELDEVEQSGNFEIIQTDGIQRVLERALRHIRSAGRSKIELGDLLVAIMDEEDSFASYYLRKQGIERLDVLTFISHGMPDSSGASGTEGQKQENSEEDSGKTDALKQFTVDLTAKAKEGKIDPLIGRESELDRAIEVLCRRRKNNPLFVGEPGVGKTAMAEGLALRIAEGNVPHMFRDTRILALDMGLVVAGTRYRGDFEARLKNIVAQFKKLENAILFIDEIHSIVGAGGTSSGSLDASNLLKPALANGELRCIGSTTYEEFRNHFEKDRALARRFQKIDLYEPSSEDCLAILQGVEDRYAAFHKVRYSSSVLQNIVDLSVRHVRDRLLPDKAIDVMDECGSAVRLKQSVKDLQANEKRVPNVTVADVERIVARMAGIPVRSVSGKERTRLANLERELKQQVFGQDQAIEQTVRAILRARAGLGQERRPAGAFLFYGPTGVGKTEVARCLADIMGVDFLRYDMSEYMEKHSVSRLIGTPPGYVGFEQGGLLTEAVRKAPYSVVLLDEIEKAHPDIFNVLLQVMDYATLTDNTGRKTDFSNVIIIMTSNAGAFEMAKKSMGFANAKRGESSDKALKEVERLFTPEFRNRLDAMIPFQNLTEDMMMRIVNKFLAGLRKSLAQRQVVLHVSDGAKRWLAQKGFDPSMGARPLRRLIRTDMEDELARELLFGKLQKGGNAQISINSGKLAFNCSKKLMKGVKTHLSKA